MAIFKIKLDKRRLSEKDKYHLTVCVFNKQAFLYLRFTTQMYTKEKNN